MSTEEKILVTRTLNNGLRSDVKDEVRLHRLGLYLLGVNIGFERVYDLEMTGYITKSNRLCKAYPLKSQVSIEERSGVQDHLIEREFTPEREVYATDLIVDDLIASSMLTEIRSKRDDASILLGDRITRKDWCLDDQMFNYSDEFYNWIISINSGWQNRLKFKRFELYKLQASRWINKEPIKFDSTLEDDVLIDLYAEERERCLENSLYALNRHLKIKDDFDRKGWIQFNGWEAQAFILYLIDCNLSLIVGKLRQIGFTTTIAGALIIKTMLSKSIFVKFVAQVGDKSQEIFDDKVKFPVSNFDPNMKPTVDSSTKRQLKFGLITSKGGKNTSGSKFVVEVPREDAVNAGTPTVLAIDEAGLVSTIGGIIAEQRPTIFRVNPETFKMEQRRQLLAWGTGGFMKDGASGFKLEYYSAKQAFVEKDYKHGLIAIFINAFAKPGFSSEFYEQEKNFAYRRKGKTGEEAPSIKFHYTYPITEEDMFLMNADSILPIPQIDAHIKRAENSRVYKNSQIGYFEPIYDYSQPYDEFSDVPYKITGAKFVPVSDKEVEAESPLACIRILSHPEKGYRFRYYQGTDPIDSESGSSKFSSAIWDRYINKPIALLNFRHSDYKFCYLQSLCLSLYFNVDTDGKELLEYNIGKGYLDYCENKGYKKKFLNSSMLPDSMQVNGASIGISKKAGNTKFILGRLMEVIFTFADDIALPEFFKQLKTYVKKITKTGLSKYGPATAGVDMDDILDAVTYAKMCADCFSNKEIITPDDGDRINFKTRYVYVGGNLTLKRVRV